MEIRKERVERVARAIHNRSLVAPERQVEFATKMASRCSVPARERALGLSDEYKVAVTLEVLSLVAKQPKTYGEALAKWRRAENKAELLRLENDALHAENDSLRREVDSLREEIKEWRYEFLIEEDR